MIEFKVTSFPKSDFCALVLPLLFPRFRDAVGDVDDPDKQSFAAVLGRRISQATKFVESKDHFEWSPQP
jgi:hypothetical protein